MHRRRFLIGAGSVTAGASAVVGSGAFSHAQMSRDANINVVNDADGLIALTTDIESDVVREENGELVVDFTADDRAGGVNVDSRYQVGAFQSGTGIDSSGYPSNSAIIITNNDTQPHNIKFTYEDDDGDMGGSEIKFQVVGDTSNGFRGPNGAVANDNNPSVTLESSSSLTDGDGGDSDEMDPGESLRISFLVDTRDGSTSDDLSGTLTVSAD